MSSPCLNLDMLSSSDDDLRDSAGLSDLSITLLCDSEEVLTPVNSDQVPSDGDLPEESVLKDKRQVIQIRASSPDVQMVEAAQAGRACESPRPIVSVASGKRMPGKVSRAISRAPLTLDMTVVCTSGVATTSVPPPAVTSVPAVITATVTSEGIDVSVGSSDVTPGSSGGAAVNSGGGEGASRCALPAAVVRTSGSTSGGRGCPGYRFAFFSLIGTVVPGFIPDVGVG